MSPVRTACMTFFLLFGIIQTSLYSFSQSTSSPVKEWVRLLESSNDNDNLGYGKILHVLHGLDSTTVFARLNELETHNSSNHYFKSRFFLLKAVAEYRFFKLAQALKLCEQALNEAYETGDDHLISFISWSAGEVMGLYQQIELSITYLLMANEIAESLEKKPAYYINLKFNLGETFFHTRQYEKCIDYIKKGLSAWPDTSAEANFKRIRYWNTIGQAYKQLGLPDSALANYNRSIQLNNKINDPIWKGINAIFLGEIYLLGGDLHKARQLIQYEYNVPYTSEPNVSAYGLQLLAKIDLLQADENNALRHIRHSLLLLRQSIDFPVQKMNYLQYAYHTAAEVFRELGNTDSFYHYTQLYGTLHDSLERVATLSNVKIAQLRINEEKNYQAVKAMQREKRTEELKRNLIIALIILLAIIGFLVLNRQKQKLKYKQKLALQEKNLAEAEVTAAKEQLQLFTQNIIDKTALIENLQRQLQNKELDTEQQKMTEELSHQTIVTEDDWNKFKSLYEKIYPGFFAKLRSKAPDITVAELRMAALTRLQLTNSQMASMLGISPDSVRKTRLRLRQRLNFPADSNLEELIAEI